jgi:RNA polymerase sigma-70 factor (ECF subfamily)
VVDYRGLFEGWEIALAKRLIDRFRSRWRSLEREDSEDLLQECLYHWYDVRSKFEPGREFRAGAFMAQVLRHKLTDLARELSAAKRGGYLDIVGLDDPLGAIDGPFEYGDLAEHERADQSRADDAFDPADARLDIDRALRALTRRQRRLCALLIEHGFDIQEVAKRMRMSRATLYREVNKIKKVFATHGLADYLRR